MKPIIVGLDPGTTLGYAILDVQGNLLKSDSSKLIDFNILIEVTAAEGIPVIAATDKKEVPGLVKRFSAKTGSKIISPDEDMLVDDKRELVREYGLKSDHERDALAAAISAFKRIRPLIEKIGRFITLNSKQHIADQLYRLVLVHGMSIRTAVELIEKPDTDEMRLVTKVVNKREYSPEYEALYRKLRDYRQESLAYLDEVASLKNRLHGIERELLILRSVKHTPDKAVSRKEQAIRSLAAKLKLLESIVKQERARNDRLNRMLSLSKHHVLVKVVMNLSNAEIARKCSLLSMKEGDILFVRDPSVAGKDALSFLKDRINVVISAKDASFLGQFTVLIADRLELVLASDDYMLYTEASVSRELRKKGMLDRLIKEYRDTRQLTS